MKTSKEHDAWWTVLTMYVLATSVHHLALFLTKTSRVQHCIVKFKIIVLHGQKDEF